jgi:mannose-6-phosphate isomerase-like protein (cupin superfamily)
MDATQAGIVPVTSGAAFDGLRAQWAELPIKVKFASAADSPEVATPFGPIHVLLRGEETGGQLGFYEQFVASGTGAGAHYQTTEDEVFYVLEGPWEFQAGSEIRAVPPGTLIYAPAHALHAFKSLGKGPPGRMLSWNMPAGHERFYVGMGAARASGLDPNQVATDHYHVVFTAKPPAVLASASKPVGKFIHRTKTEIVASGGNEIATLLSPDESAGRFSVREIVTRPGAVPRVTTRDNRYLFTVAGEWDIEAGGERRAVGPGVAVSVPAGAGCSARFTGDPSGTLLEITAPI